MNRFDITVRYEISLFPINNIAANSSWIESLHINGFGMFLMKPIDVLILMLNLWSKKRFVW